MITEIELRTKAGKDFENRQFTKYSKSYEQFRKEKGRSTTPNLEFTGEMLASMNYEVQRQNGLVGIIKFNNAAAAAKARKHNIEGVGRKKILRKFFALSRSQIRRVTEAVESVILEVMKTK